MSWCVHLNVVFACDSNDNVAALAKQHLDNLTEKDCREARWFLTDLSERTGGNEGPKGGLSLWGIIANHVNTEYFVETLRPFWTNLLTKELDGGPHDFEHILVFYEPEQSERANAYEIFLDEGDKTLIVKHHPGLPFCWGQF